MEQRAVMPVCQFDAVQNGGQTAERWFGLILQRACHRGSNCAVKEITAIPQL
jgi:hypothetical protein